MHDDFRYRDDAKTILFRVPNWTHIEIPLSVVDIYGKEEKDYAFIDARDTVTSVTFPQDNNIQYISQLAFYKCSKLESLDFSVCTKLKAVRNFAFAYCTGMKVFTFPNNTVTSIGEYAFSHCSALESLYIPASVESIGRVAFYSCTSIKSIVFDPEIKITGFAPGLFYSCKSLPSILVPKSVNYVQNTINSCEKLVNLYVAPGNKNLHDIDGVIYSTNNKTFCMFPRARTGTYTILEGVKTISSCAFVTAQITKVVLPQSLEIISDNAFSGTKLTEITFPDSIQTIDVSAFSGSNLQSVRFPNKVKKIGDGCFANCQQLTYVYMPTTYESIGGGIFASCSSKLVIEFAPDSDFKVKDQQLVYSNNDKKVCIYLGSAEKVTINNYVEEIGAKIFYKNSKVKTIEFQPESKLNTIGRFAFCESVITSIILPPTITTICEYAFQDCKALETVKFGSSLTTIENYGFNRCDILSSIEFTGTTTACSTDVSAFDSCPKLGTVKFANGIKKIGKLMFHSCISLTTISIPQSIETIESFAFQNTSLETLTIDPQAKITELPSHLCDGCPNLTNINVPDIITVVGTYCFANTKIPSFTIPSGVEIINEFCFQNCKEMVEFHIPANSKLQRFQYGVFAGCTSFAKITCDCPEFSINNGALYNKLETKLWVVPPKLPVSFFSFPETLETIGESALLGCIYIVQIFIPSKSLSVVEKYAFEDCSNLLMINFPSCLTTVGMGAFRGCTKLQCGLLFDYQSQEYKEKLVIECNLPRRCIMDCDLVCEKIRENHHKGFLGLFSFSFLFLAD